MKLKYPYIRMRRRRLNPNIRELSRQYRLSVKNLILPLFVLEGENQQIEIKSMPGIYRYSIDRLVKVCEYASSLGIPAVALFPVTPENKKDDQASEALNPDNLVCRALKHIKPRLPELILIADVALDPYTSHGHDGLIDPAGYVLNDPTIEVLVKQAVLLAQAGADIIAPSDMMDGRIGKIRNQLDIEGMTEKLICAYSAKYASSFYGPFRDAIDSKKNLANFDKKTYQMDPANSKEAIYEAELDINEGADYIMVKPALPYLDIVYQLKLRFNLPIFAYQVSGEYACILAAGSQGWVDPHAVMLESLLSIRRAGAQAIFCYDALNQAKILANFN